MKLFLILLISILTVSANGQTEPKSINDVKTGLNGSVRNNTTVSDKTDCDTIPSVVFVHEKSDWLQPAFFINGKHSNIIPETINPQSIDSMNVVREDVLIEGEKFYGKIFIKMKKDYSPKLISLTNLKLEHTQLADTPVIFMIDDDIIKGDYSKCVVDEKYILKIIVDKVEDEKNNLDISIVRLLTKTEENIKKSNIIRIRGKEEAMLD